MTFETVLRTMVKITTLLARHHSTKELFLFLFALYIEYYLPITEWFH
jgi:hypothetical protein